MIVTEQQLETATISWFGEVGWQYVSGPTIAPDGEQPARSDYRQVVLRERLFAALARINPHIPAAPLELIQWSWFCLLFPKEGSC